MRYRARANFIRTGPLSLFHVEENFSSRRILYRMNHKRLLYLVVLVISDFSNHEPLKTGRKADRTFRSGNNRKTRDFKIFSFSHTFY